MGGSRIILRKKRLLLAYLWWKKLKRQELMHVHPLNRTRKEKGEYFTLINMLEKYPGRFHQYFRMSKKEFDEIFQIVEEDLKPKPLSFRRDVICAKEKLVITLRFLATGTSFVDLAFRYRMGVSTVKTSIDQTINAIISNCLRIAIPDKLTTADWNKISTEFLQRWNFPNCLGAVDGKHALTFAPKKSGSLYFNYKKSFSYNLMAVVDANYKFLMVDIGAYGSNADSTVFSNSYFGNAWLNNPSSLNIPEDSPLPGTTSKLPHVIIGDEGFALKKTILRPFPGHNLSTKERLFNYRLSRARRVVENAFGILSQTWRILLKRMEVDKSSATNIILACCILHNLLRTNISEALSKHNATTSERNVDINEVITSIPASCAYDIRDKFADWCVSEGDVEFQHRMI